MSEGIGRLDHILRLISPVKTTDDAGQAGTLSVNDIENIYLIQGQEELDSRLERWYQVPFTEITRDSVTSYPKPLNLIVELLTASYILLDQFHETSGTMRYSDKATNYLTRANTLIQRIQNREIILDGQRAKSESVFVSQQIRPPVMTTQSSAVPPVQ